MLALFVAADYAPAVDGEAIRLLHTALTHSNVIVAARDGHLVGIARGWSDFAAICYLADIAVHRDWRRRGIGSVLMRAFRREAGGTEVDLLLLSRPVAENFYRRLGLEPAPQARRSPGHAGP